MALDVKIGIINNADDIIISDNSGDYNVVSNPTGWGSPNYARTSAYVRSISLDIYLPGSTTSIGTSSLQSTTFLTGTARAYQLFTDPATVVPSFQLQDGIWKYEMTIGIDSTGGSGTANTTIQLTTANGKAIYSLRDNDLKCAIGKLALGNMDTNNYLEVKNMYDKMRQAFECQEYTLAQELYEEIQDMLTDCYPMSINSCGC